jgi:predicted XRE-type DNA-binding protein
MDPMPKHLKNLIKRHSFAEFRNLAYARSYAAGCTKLHMVVQGDIDDDDENGRFGSADEFLGLAPEEAAYIEIRLALAEHLKARRRAEQVTQLELARRMKSSQSRVAKLEDGDPSVSLDLLIRSLLALGASPEDLATYIHAA